MSKKSQKKIHWKGILILEAIIFYFAILNVISYMRAPAVYERAEEPLIQTEEFQPYVQMGSVTENILPLVNQQEGTVVGYEKDISSEGLEQLQIQCHIDCPEQYLDAAIFIDLYQESGYDDPQREQVINLKSGSNDIDVCLEVGDNPPETILVRLFTPSVIDVEIENLQVFEMVKTNRVHPAMYGAVIISGVLYMGTFLLAHTMKKKSQIHDRIGANGE